MAKKGGILSKRALTAELRKLAAEIHSIDEDGNPITNEQKLAHALWNEALGWTEELKDEKGNLKENYHPPAAWAQQFIYERLEGKVAPATVEDGSRVTAAETVRKLAVAQLNKLVEDSEALKD